MIMWKKVLNIRLQKFAHIEGLDVLYFSLGLMLCISVPIASIGPSFVVWPNLAMFAAIGLSVMAIRDFPAVIGSMNKSSRVLFLIIPIYLAVDFLIGFSRFNVPIQYPLWTLCVFILWLLVVPWLFFKKGSAVIYAMAWGVFVGGIINAVTVVADMHGFSLVMIIMEHMGREGAGPLLRFIGGDGDYTLTNGIGLFSYSRTVTGLFLAASTALSFSLLSRTHWKVIIQSVFLVGIIYTGSRIGVMSWLFVMLIGYRNIGLRNGAFLLIWVFSLLGLLGFLGVFEMGGLQGRFINSLASFQEALYVRIGYQKQAIPSCFFSIQTFFGSGPNMAADMLGWDKMGLNMYEAHGSPFQYLAELGLIGLFLYITVVARVLKEYWSCIAVWGLFLSFGLSQVVDGFFFPKPQAVYFPIVFAIIFLMIGSQSDETNKSDRSNSQEVH